MFNFFRCWEKIGLITLVVGCMAARIYVAAVIQLRHRMDVPMVVAAILSTVVAGASVIVVIVAVRPSDFKSIGDITLIGFFGAGLGIFALSDWILRGHYGYDHGEGESATSDFVAAITGAGWSLAVYFAVQSYRHRPPA